MTDYKKYSLENLENWLHDAISSGDATPQEIYDVIVKVVRENYEYHKQQADQSNELLALLNDNGWSYEDVMKEKEYYEPSMPPWGHSDLEYAIHNKKPLSCDKDDPSPECQKSWNNFWEESPYPVYVSEDGDMWSPDYVNKKEDKVNRWVLPVQVDGLSGECYINLPDDLLERAGLKEGDMVHWIDRKDGSFEMRKVNGPE